jgi:hypothetical protein
MNNGLGGSGDAIGSPKSEEEIGRNRKQEQLDRAPQNRKKVRFRGYLCTGGLLLPLHATRSQRGSQHLHVLQFKDVRFRHFAFSSSPW